MAEKLGEALLELGTDDRAFDAGVTRAESRTRQLGRQLAEAGRRATRLGRNLSIGVTAPVMAMGLTSIRAFRVQEKAVAAVDAALASMGDAAGFTSDELQKMASKLQGESLFGDEEILSRLTANLLTFGNISGDVFERTQQAAIDLSARLGQDLQSSAIQLGKALNDPAKGLTALTRIGVAFTEQQKEQIKAMAEAGDVAGAQALMLGEIEKQYGGQARAAADADQGVTQLANAWGDFQEQIGAVLNEFVVPVTAGLRSVVDWLQALDPATRNWIVGIAAAAAAIGPVLAAVGLFATGLGALVPVIIGVGAALSAAFVLATGPIGLTIAAIAGLTAIWTIWGDDITRIVSQTVTAVQTWLVDRFNAIVGSVKEKIDSVVGFFTGMYDVVVGNSIVPDMVDEIGAEFARLGPEMVDRTATATDAATGLFAGMERASGMILSKMENALASFIETGEFDVKSFVGSVLSDLGRMAMRAGMSALFGVPTLNDGASFMVGGSGGTDTNLVAFRATKGERVDVTPAAQVPLMNGRETGGGLSSLTVNVDVSGARGNAEIEEMVRRGVSAGLSSYDADVLPARVGQIANDPRAR